MRLGDFTEALGLRDDAALEVAGEDAAGGTEQPEDEKHGGIRGQAGIEQCAALVHDFHGVEEGKHQDIHDAGHNERRPENLNRTFHLALPLSLLLVFE